MSSFSFLLSGDEPDELDVPVSMLFLVLDIGDVLSSLDSPLVCGYGVGVMKASALTVDSFVWVSGVE